MTDTAAPEEIAAVFSTISLPTLDPVVNCAYAVPPDVVSLEYVAVPVPSAALSVVKALAVSRPEDAAGAKFDDVMATCASRTFKLLAVAFTVAGIDPSDEP